jgi:folate-binding protein YgfZ
MTEQPRQMIAVTGDERHDFLQGLVSNAVPTAPGRLVYAALLTPQGKYLADFFMLERDGALLVDVAAPLAAGLAQRLAMYRLRRKIGIDGIDLTVACGTGTPPLGALPDPRHPDLGWRAYGLAEGGDATDWTALRCALCIPESGIELIPNETFILEAGFERLHGVDFRKGCYVGQEVTARMKHKTELKTGLATVKVAGRAPVGSEIRADGKPAGRLFSQAGGLGIAYLRFDRATGEMETDGAKVSRLEVV